MYKHHSEEWVNIMHKIKLQGLKKRKGESTLNGHWSWPSQVPPSHRCKVSDRVVQGNKKNIIGATQRCAGIGTGKQFWGLGKRGGWDEWEGDRKGSDSSVFKTCM